MSYTPTTWAAGDTVTAAKLNKLEQGVASGGGVLVVHDVEGTLDKTAAEIFAAAEIGGAVVCVGTTFPIPMSLRKTVGYYGNMPDGSYTFICIDNNGTYSYSASTGTDYPTANA